MKSNFSFFILHFSLLKQSLSWVTLTNFFNDCVFANSRSKSSIQLRSHATIERTLLISSARKSGSGVSINNALWFFSAREAIGTRVFRPKNPRPRLAWRSNFDHNGTFASLKWIQYNCSIPISSSICSRTRFRSRRSIHPPRQCAVSKQNFTGKSVKYFL